MLILYALEDSGKFKKHDIIAFHSSIFDATKQKKFEPAIAAFPDKSFTTWGILKNKTATLVLPDNQKVMDEYWNYKVTALQNNVERKVIPFLKLTTDAKDNSSPYDGYPDIPADGISSTTIYIRKMLPGETLCDKVTDNDELYIKTDRGRLSALKIKLEKGRAQFKITSVPETVLATITVYDPKNILPSSQLILQFA